MTGSSLAVLKALLFSFISVDAFTHTHSMAAVKALSMAVVPPEPPSSAAAAAAAALGPVVAAAAAASLASDPPQVAPDLPEKLHTSLFDIAQWSDASSSSGPLALILLNKRTSKRSVLWRLWHSAKLRICADGGANCLYDSFTKDNYGNAERECYIPHVIKGDLDSLRPSVLSYYYGQGSTVMQVADQNCNDFEKCLKEVLDRAGGAAAAAATTVVAVGAFGGRFDQEIASFHLLHKYTPLFDRFILVGNGNFR